MNQMVNILKTTPISTRWYRDDTWEFVPRNWFHRLLLKLFVRCGAKPFYNVEMSVKIERFDQRDLLDLIFEHHSLIQQVYNKQVTTILCGRDVYERLMHSALDQMHTFGAFPFRLGNGMEVTTIYNLRIVLVPWMEGIVGIPDIKKETP